MITEQQRKLIRECLSDFNFDKVHRYMVDSDWTWHNPDGEDYIPSVIQLYQKAEELLEDAVEKNIPISTGGLFVEVADGYVNLKFCIAESFAESEV